MDTELTTLAKAIEVIANVRSTHSARDAGAKMFRLHAMDIVRHLREAGLKIVADDPRQ